MDAVTGQGKYFILSWTCAEGPTQQQTIVERINVKYEGALRLLGYIEEGVNSGNILTLPEGITIGDVCDTVVHGFEDKVGIVARIWGIFLRCLCVKVEYLDQLEALQAMSTRIQASLADTTSMNMRNAALRLWDRGLIRQQLEEIINYSRTFSFDPNHRQEEVIFRKALEVCVQRSYQDLYERATNHPHRDKLYLDTYDLSRSAIFGSDESLPAASSSASAGAAASSPTSSPTIPELEIGDEDMARLLGAPPAVVAALVSNYRDSSRTKDVAPVASGASSSDGSGSTTPDEVEGFTLVQPRRRGRYRAGAGGRNDQEE